MKLRSYTILREPDPADKAGGKPADPPAATPPAADPAVADIGKRIDALLKAHGDSNGAVRALLTERDQIAAQLSETRTKLPKEGSTILDPEMGKVWTRYQALGKPEDLEKALSERDEFRTKAADYEWQQRIVSVAEAAKVKPSVLAKLAKTDRTEFVVKDEPDPKDPTKRATVQAAYVKGVDDKGAETLTPFDDHAERHWKDFLPSLKGTQGHVPAPLGSPPPSGGPPRPPVKPSAADRPRSNPLS